MGLNNISDKVYCLPHEEETDIPVLGYVKGDKYTLGRGAENSIACNHTNKK